MKFQPHTIHRIYDAGLQKTFGFGRHYVAPEPGAPEPLRLKHFMTGAQPPKVLGTPKRPDWAALAISGLEDIDGNDSSGDCVYAAIMKIVCLLIANAGLGLPFPSRAEAWGLYSRVLLSMGYPAFDPAAVDAKGANPTDLGGNLPSVMDYITANGCLADGSFKPVARIAVDAHDPVQLKTAIWVFGHLYKGAYLPKPWVTPMPQKSGFRWDVAGPGDKTIGHSTFAYGANNDGTFDGTWGEFGTVTYRANSAYYTPDGSRDNPTGEGECYALLFPNWIRRGMAVAPNGLAWAELEEAVKTWNQPATVAA